MRYGAHSGSGSRDRTPITRTSRQSGQGRSSTRHPRRARQRVRLGDGGGAERHAPHDAHTRILGEDGAIVHWLGTPVPAASRRSRRPSRPAECIACRGVPRAPHAEGRTGRAEPEPGRVGTRLHVSRGAGSRRIGGRRARTGSTARTGRRDTAGHRCPLRCTARTRKPVTSRDGSSSFRPARSIATPRQAGEDAGICTRPPSSAK